MTVATSSAPKIRLGVVGLGRAFTLMLPTFMADSRIEIVGAADPRAEARARFETEFRRVAHERIESLCDDRSVEVVYIASPHQLHAEHARIAAAAGKHVLIEKPMALSIDECQSMIDSAERARVHLIVGHSHSFDAPILRTRELIASGEFGPLRMLTALNFTDFMYRPRRPEELSTPAGGGVVWSQAAHQVDIVRLLAGGVARSVHALTGAWDRARPTEGAYSALVRFDHAFASLTHPTFPVRIRRSGRQLFAWIFRIRALDREVRAIPGDRFGERLVRLKGIIDYNNVSAPAGQDTTD